MRSRRILTPIVAAIAFSAALVAAPAGAAPSLAGGPTNRLISSSGTTSFHAGPAGVDGLQFPEIRNPESEDGMPPFDGIISDRSHSHGRGKGEPADDHGMDHSNAQLLTSFAGLNLRDQRLANGGNQFTVEPPDQGMCAGNGFVLESVNDVLRVFDTSGNALQGVVDLNTFYGYAPAIVRSTRTFGPFVTDPSCYFDNDTQHWFQTVLTLDTDSTTGGFTGPNHIDLAVSKTASPLGEWTIYRLPVQDDGTQGTPNHGCSLGPCIGDYPHIGADKYGFYVTTNEYSLFGPEFKSANIYAFSKQALAAAASTVNVVNLETVGAVNGNPGFTVWPATSPAGSYEQNKGGTEYFLSSNAADEANGTHVSNQIIVWALSNTRSLSTNAPAIQLSNTVVTVNRYGVPPRADQKAGDFPLGQCLSDPAPLAIFGGLTCSQALAGTNPAPEQLSPLDANDTRMQQVTFAKGKLYGALDTALTINGVNKAGIAWFIFDPSIEDRGVKAKVENQGYLGLANNNLTYPAIGVTSSGKGVMAFTVVGKDFYPSAGYAVINTDGVGSVHIAALGAGPQDGFSGYKAFGNPPRPRWGDYGAAAPVGDSVWIASEYIAQTCTLDQYRTAPFGSCGGTRVSLGNWATRISQVKP
jgi:hypothetical protein